MSANGLDKRLVTVSAAASSEAERYQTLRLRVEHLHRTRDVRVIAITSPGAKDGKTLTALNLASALTSGSDARVLLIEADLRRPMVGTYLGLNGNTPPGLADLVLDPGRTLGDVAYRHEPLTFSVVVAGSTTAPVHEVFRSPRLEATLQEARQRYDYVVLDTPPLGHVSDCALLARWVDGLLIVVAAHKTPRKQLEEALNLLEGTNVLGIVFNGDDRPAFGYRYYDYRKAHART